MNLSVRPPNGYGDADPARMSPWPEEGESEPMTETRPVFEGQRITVADDVVWTRVDDEIIVIDPQSERFFGVRGAGIEAWEAIVHGATADQALTAILARYDVPEARAKTDLDELLGSLLERRLIGISDPASPD